MKETIRSRVFLTWALSYFFVLLMPLIMGNFVYRQSINTIKEEITNVNSMALKQIQSVLDANFAEVYRIAGNLSLNQDVRKLMSTDKPLEPRNIRAIVDIQRDLAGYLMTDTMIEEIYVHIKNNNYIVTSAYKYNNDMIADVCKRSLGLSSEEFETLSNTKFLKELRFTTDDAEGGAKQTRALYISSLFLNNYKEPAGTLIIKLNMDRIKQLLRNIELMNQGEVLLVNARGEFYRTDSQKLLPEQLNYETIDQMGGTFHGQIDGQSTTVAHIASDQVNLKYVSLVPTAVFLQKVMSIRNMMISYVILCLLLGGAVSLVLARRNYSPLQKLKRMLESRITSNQTLTGNEYKDLEETLCKLLDEENRIKDMLEKQADTQRNSFLARLLKGRLYSGEHLPLLLRTYRIAFSGELFLVAAAYIEQVDEDALRNYRDDENIYGLIFSVVKSTGEELVGVRFDTYVTELGGIMAFIINASDESFDAFHNGCVEALEKTVAFLHESFGISLSICLSSVKHGVETLPDAYSETLAAREYRLFTSREETLVCYDDIKKAQPMPNRDVLALSKQKMLMNCMDAHDYDGVLRIVDELIASDCRNMIPIQLIKMRVVGLISIALVAAQEIDKCRVEAEPINQLLMAKSAEDLLEREHIILEGLFIQHDDLEKNQGPDCILTATQYVNAHYKEPDLSVAGLAEKLGVSMSYLSRTFKKYKGIGLLDFIHITRIEHAKELLLFNIPVGQVAEQVGYYDSKALIRAFRRYEGITPAKMRGVSKEK